MNEKRFFTKINKNGRNVIIDKECHIELIELTLACEVLNRLDLKLKTYNEQLGEQQAIIDKQNELIKLIANACTYSKEHSVKEILRKEIRGIDTVTEESANAWHDYLILSEFFEEHYKEHWDNE